MCSFMHRLADHPPCSPLLNAISWRRDPIHRPRGFVGEAGDVVDFGENGEVDGCGTAVEDR
jgi:hypothetical protein